MAIRGEGGKLQTVRSGTSKLSTAGQVAGKTAQSTYQTISPQGGGKSVGIILLAGVIVIGNEFVQTPGSTFVTFVRPAVATLGVAWLFSGLEKLDSEAAVGLAAIVMVTVLFGGLSKAKKSPAQEVVSLFGGKAK